MSFEVPNNEETWELLHLESGIYSVGDPYPNINFDFYIKDVSEKNVYCSSKGIEDQIKHALQINPNREKVVYFFYKRSSF